MLRKEAVQVQAAYEPLVECGGRRAERSRGVSARAEL